MIVWLFTPTREYILPGIMVKQNELHGISSKQVYNMSKSLSEVTLSA